MFEVSVLDNYKELYFYLFSAIADATEHLERGETLLACDRLIRAQREAEASHMDFDILPEQ